MLGTDTCRIGIVHNTNYIKKLEKENNGNFYNFR